MTVDANGMPMIHLAEEASRFLTSADAHRATLQAAHGTPCSGVSVTVGANELRQKNLNRKGRKETLRRDFEIWILGNQRVASASGLGRSAPQSGWGSVSGHLQTPPIHVNRRAKAYDENLGHSPHPDGVQRFLLTPKLDFFGPISAILPSRRPWRVRHPCRSWRFRRSDRWRLRLG